MKATGYETVGIDSDPTPEHFAWIAGLINKNQHLLLVTEQMLDKSSRASAYQSNRLRLITLLLTGAIPLTQLPFGFNDAQGLVAPWLPIEVGTVPKLIAGLLAALVAITSGLQALFKYEAKAQGSRMLSALAASKREMVMTEGAKIRLESCPRLRFGQALGLLGAQTMCLDTIRSKACELDLDLGEDHRNLNVDFSDDFAEANPSDPRQPKEARDSEKRIKVHMDPLEHRGKATPHEESLV